MTTYTREKLIDCLANEYAYLCFEDESGTPEELAEYIEGLHEMTYEQLIEETGYGTPDELKTFVEHYEESTYRRNTYDEPTITNGN